MNFLPKGFKEDALDPDEDFLVVADLGEDALSFFLAGAFFLGAGFLAEALDFGAVFS